MFCMALEACCCYWISTLATREIMFYNFRIQLDPMDEYIICCTVAISCCVSIARLLGGRDAVPDEVEDLVDLLTCIVMGCMLAQQEVELKHRETQGNLPQGKYLQVGGCC